LNERNRVICLRLYELNSNQQKSTYSKDVKITFCGGKKIQFNLSKLMVSGKIPFK